MCFLALSIGEEGLSSGDDKPRDPYNAARPRANWIFLKGVYPRVLFQGSGCHEWRFRRGGLAQSVGLAQEAAKWNRKPKKMRQEVGAGGDAAREGCCDACSGRGARCALCGSAALKSARAGSRQKVSRRALRKEPRSDFFSCFLNENESEICN